MKKILILMGHYLPGYKDGGPLRTIANVVETLGDDYNFYIACYDRDHGDSTAYANIQKNSWNQVGKAKVWYVKPGGFSNKLLIDLSEGMDLIYLCSFYDDYGYKVLFLRKKKKIVIPVALASMGVFSKQALEQKALKKKVFISGCKMLGLFKNICWSVTSQLEAQDVQKRIGKIDYIVAEDLPRSNVPGIKNEHGNKNICFLSRICAHKGLDIAIDALIAAKLKNINFTIYGPIQEKEYWENCRRKLESAVFNWTYGGDVSSEKVQEVLAKQDILILPTKSENYGHVIFEALSVGCIPIISNRTPWTELESRSAGYIVSLNPEEFRKAIIAFYNLSNQERNIRANCAVQLALDKVEQVNKHTGYRDIFG